MTLKVAFPWTSLFAYGCNPASQAEAHQSQNHLTLGSKKPQPWKYPSFMAQIKGVESLFAAPDLSSFLLTHCIILLWYIFSMFIFPYLCAFLYCWNPLFLLVFLFGGILKRVTRKRSTTEVAIEPNRFRTKGLDDPAVSSRIAVSINTSKGLSEQSTHFTHSRPATL